MATKRNYKKEFNITAVLMCAGGGVAGELITQVLEDKVPPAGIPVKGQTPSEHISFGRPIKETSG